ncbi:MAG: SMC-Scp complex subunit ScpB [Candidatus Vogelbacteria bacterium]|nr:SMC-Scp complex subunit ScpB [Candidatus Vogelbacteria bacterium]
MNLSATIEAILFFKAEPLTIKKLAELTNQPEETIQQALGELKQTLQGRGIALLEKDNTVILGTAPEVSGLIESIIKEELNKDLGKAGLETLAIVLYKGPVSRAEIDYIRGVNSSFILRNLTVRGLVEKINKEGDNRTFLYRPTFELLAHLGLTSVTGLPNYDTFLAELVKVTKPSQDETPTN